MTTARRRAETVGRQRIRRLFIVSLVVAGILFTFANPARTWFDQRQEIAAARERNIVLDEQSQELRARAATLRTDEEIERIAREEYGLVKPGEEAFGILPAPGSGPPKPEAEPPPPPRSVWRTAWDAVTFWK